MIEKRLAAATLGAVVSLFAPKAADSLTLIPCGTMTDHYVRVDKEYLEHRLVVKRGDTLWKISRDAYGNPTRFPEIAEHNGIPNPDLIFPGQEIRIPREDYEFLGRRYDDSGQGVCPVTDRSGFQYTGRVNHPRGTTRESISFNFILN